MAARGSVAKEELTQKILETFPGAFTHEKEIRIPMTENGELIQIKVTLTAAKANVENIEGRRRTGGALEECIITDEAPVASISKPVATVTEPSADEKAKVADLLARLGL